MPLCKPGHWRRNIKHGKEEKTNRRNGKNTALRVVGGSSHAHDRHFPPTMTKLRTNVEQQWINLLVLGGGF